MSTAELERPAVAVVAILLAAALSSTASIADAAERCPGPLASDVCAEANPVCPPAPPATGLANSEWPIFQHDAQHTGKGSLAGPTCANVIWQQKLLGKVLSAPSIGLPGPGETHGVLYVPAFKFPICAMNPADGSILWCDTTDLGKLPDRSSPALGNGDGLFIGTRDNDLWAIDLPTFGSSPASVAWRQKVCSDGDISTSPLVGPDGTIYFGSDSLNAGTVMAMCPGATRQLRWCINPVGGGVKNVAPALSPAGDQVYVTFNGTTLVALDPATGAEAWRIQLESQVNGFRGANYSPVVHPVTGRIYVGLDSGVFAVDRVNPGAPGETAQATLLFDTEAARRQRIYSPPALDVANDALYVGASRGAKTSLYAIDLAGNVKWERVLPRTNFRNTPPVIDAAGNVYVVARQKLLAFEPNGDPLFEFTGQDPFFSGAVLGDGRLYVASGRGRVYAIGDCL